MDIGDAQSFLASVALGIRYRSYSLEDKIGSALDDILYTQGSFFNPEFFPSTIQTPLGGRALINEETSNSLSLSASDIILEYNLPTTGAVDWLEKVIETFNGQIIEGVMKKYDVHQISRVGIVRKYLFTIPELAKNFLNHSIGKTIEGVNDINLRFSKRYPMDEALIKKGVNDYINVIFNVIKIVDKDELFISVDYQWYFLPPLEKISQLKFNQFIEKARHYNKESFPQWVVTNYGSNK